MQKKRRFGIIQFARLMMAEWQSAETLHPGASREAAIKMAGGLSIMSNMDDFKAGKILVWAETKADAERFLAELARKEG